MEVATLARMIGWRRWVLCVMMLFMFPCWVHADVVLSRTPRWSVKLDSKKGYVNCLFDDSVAIRDVYCRVKVDDRWILSSDYAKTSMRKRAFSDELGRGVSYDIRYTDKGDRPVMRQVIRCYDSLPVFTVSVTLEAKDSLRSNYMSPLCSDEVNKFLPTDNSNRALRIPFDNDNFVHYLSSPAPVEDLSFEATAIFNGASRRGMVIGSIEHHTWKTGIAYSLTADGSIDSLACFGGVTHPLTRDVWRKGSRRVIPHGSIEGMQISSPRVLVGMFDDWREGMECYGWANAVISPPRKWNGGTPFGWNSWAALEKRLNYEGAVSVAEFIHEELQTRGFSNDDTLYIGLDSYWANLSEEQLSDFVLCCHAMGLKAGIYWCPFSDWVGNHNAEVEGSGGKWHYRDIYLRSRGVPRRIESLAVDPTHEGTKMRMNYFVEKFRRLGFSYIKLDFINNGALEADSFFEKGITTGIQAYNHGMNYLSELCGDDFFLALSIAPVFPAQYGNSRRISCDTWGAMSEREWGSTGYMLNSLSFGWWLDRVYNYNDADHILLYKPEEAELFEVGANRARVTSAVITGMYMLGDNFSDRGWLPADGEARRRALEVVTNSEVNDIARIGRSFRPLEGYTAYDASKAERAFILNYEGTTYLALFNFESRSQSGSIEVARMGLPSGAYKAVELWRGVTHDFEDVLHYEIPQRDVLLYRIEKQ